MEEDNVKKLLDALAIHENLIMESRIIFISMEGNENEKV